MVTGSDKVELEAIIVQLEHAVTGLSTDVDSPDHKAAKATFDHGLERLKGLVP
jgi:hypothetical protein